MYSEKDLVRIAKRENNKKRNYLVVNCLQGKHIPVRPSEAFDMFDKLACKINDKYTGENILFIGFAETATAIGAAVAHKYGKMYMQTTREIIEGAEYLFFSEEHSHATEQKLIKDDMDIISKEVDRIIFVEDEVTTGKTILNIISILNKQYPEIRKYAVMSLLNGMNFKSLNVFEKKEIDLYYLVKTNHDNYSEIAEQFKGNGKYINVEMLEKQSVEDIKIFEFDSYLNARRLIDMKVYDSKIDLLWKKIEYKLYLKKYKNILVLGTEEFMYPALKIAEKIEAFAENVRCHSTTRSPIVVSNEGEYPLNTRYELKSLYDQNRKNFIYNLGKYDCVLVITDADINNNAGVNTLAGALKVSGNNNINFIRWC